MYIAKSIPVSYFLSLKAFLKKRKIKSFWWYVFFMAFPVIVIFQNISIFLFPFLLIAFKQRFGYFLKIRHPIQIVAILFGLGAIASVVYMPNYGVESLPRALAVLPNYLYWSLLLVFLISHHRNILFSWLYEAVTLGLLLTVLYYFVMQEIGILSLVIFKGITPNAFAFILIIFTPISLYYIKKRFGFFWGLAALVGFTLCGFLSGSRSGSLLTLAGASMAFFSGYLKYGRKTLVIMVLAVFALVMVQTTIVKNLIKSLNPRVYDLVYETERVRTKDGSYLIRLAMVEKALSIHDRYPYTGIGLNNFSYFKTKIEGDFEGSDFVMHKVNKEPLSSHNSYMGLLAEGGYFVIIPLLILLAYPLIYFFIFMNKIPENKKPVFIGLIVMAVHMYFVFGIVNVFAWFMIGVANALATYNIRDFKKMEIL